MSQRRFLWLWGLAVLAASLAFVVHLTVRFETIRLGYEVGSARRAQRQLMEELRLLSIEAGVLKQASRIERIAQERLGLTHPRHAQIVTLDRESRLAVRAGGVR